MVTRTSPATPTRPAGRWLIAEKLGLHTGALVPGLAVAALLILWAAHDGGYNTDTWYWGALVLLGMLGVVLISFGSTRLPALSRPARVALAAFALYVAWSYLSIAWAGSPGDALQG